MATPPDQPVPDCVFERRDGTPVRLSEFAARALVLVFLRHLAWLACRAHLGEVRKHYPEIERLGGRVLAVSFTPAAKASAYLEKHPLPFPAVFDPSRRAYRAFELGHTSWRDILRPRVLARYLKLVLRGWLPNRPQEGEDMMQLGGDFVLDGRRRLVFAYRSADPADRPAAEELVKAVRAAVRSDWRRPRP